ncbi:MAG: T9SS type A sorting domain-containing protein [Bacteroidales bacterium]|nr:T9SS type A sorting domain-containing protein [Bacteroidales bacterium]
MKTKFLTIILLLLLFGGAANAQVRTNVYDLEGNEIVSDYMYWGYGLYFSYFSFPDFFQDDSMYCQIGIGNWGTYALDDIRVITFSHPIIGINEIDASNLQLTPNPARDKVTLSGIGDTPQQAVLYNVTGVKLRELTVTDGSTMDISQLPEGLYILRCGSHSAKIVKQK